MRALVVVTLVAALLVGIDGNAVALPTEGISITITLDGAAAAEDFTVSITPEVPGCTDEQIVVVPSTGGEVVVPAIDAVAGPIAFDSDDFTLTPVFGNVESFSFEMNLTGIQRDGNYVGAPFESLEYQVNGNLSGTPSGFPSFNLVRSMDFFEFVAQQSGYGFVPHDGADLSDGLQVEDLFGDNIVFVLDAVEKETGRYHPPKVELRADGTGRIQNSTNSGGVNPQTLEVVDVDFGEEYITDMLFDPAELTLAPGLACTYSISQTVVPGYEVGVASVSGVSASGVVAFANTAVPVVCDGHVVTIDMRSNGGIGTGTAANDVILGTSGADEIDGLDGDDIICGLGGDDHILAGPGDDHIFGQSGNDKLFGRQGADTIDGGEGDDTIHGNLGNDILTGSGGADRIFGYAGDDTIDGGDGDDRLHGNFGEDVISGGPGADRIFGYGDADELAGGSGSDWISGNFGDDILRGNSGDDVLWGADGDDVLWGEFGNDELHGNSLDDVLHGGQGDDVLDGGIGTDICNGNAGVDSGSRCENISGLP